jgi:murein DD-endopeptidase MepM/ murein hydrolase activator NlpD
VVVVVLSTLGTTLAVASASPGTAAASIRSDRTTVIQLEQRIASQGALVQSLVSRYDRVEGHMAAIEGQIASGHVRLVVDHRAETEATIRLRQVAIDAYMNAAAGTSTVLSSSSATTLQEQDVYMDAASGTLDAAMATLHLDQDRTAATQSALSSEQASTRMILRQLASAREAAQAAIDTDNAILSRVSANLVALVTAANERRKAAEEQQAEQALAAAAAQRAATTPAPSPPSQPSQPAPSPQHAPGGYANPLRAISDLMPERIDQGVDYSGSGPIYAVGDGVVLSTVNAGWPGGTFIAYRLTDGPANGLVVYAAEDIDPAVQVGETVGPSTVLGQMYEGPDGIETGWADPSALGLTMAAEYGQFNGSNSTAFGYNFSQLLQSLGAPGGVLQNDPATGGLPRGWPQW